MIYTYLSGVFHIFLNKFSRPNVSKKLCNERTGKLSAYINFSIESTVIQYKVNENWMEKGQQERNDS